MAYFKNIKLSNFRNFKDFNLDFSKKCNVFYGSNGCGKTNLLEAISIFSKGRGLRKDKIFNFIKKNEEFFSNDANFIDENVEYELNAFSEVKNNKFQKKIKLNGEISSEVNNKIQSLITFLISPSAKTSANCLWSTIKRQDEINQTVPSKKTAKVIILFII